MGRMVRSCLQSTMKLVNSLIGMAGIAMVLYALWMIRVWYNRMGGGGDILSQVPWFIYTILGIGLFLCFVTCSGHIAAETANGHCLSCYMLVVFLLLMLEAALVADVFLNKSWEEVLPDDPTGKFHELEDFIRSNFEICKWIGLAVVGAQAFSILIAIILRALGPDRGDEYDSDDEFVPARLPLLRNQTQNSPYVVNEPQASMNKNNPSWNMNINDKVSR